MKLLTEAGVAHGVDADWGLDHGTWVPMMVMYPEAGMPAWLTATVTQGDEQGLAGYREQAPYATRAHPRPDHFMPLLVAYGAAGKGATGEVLHRSWYWGDLSMAAYQFASRGLRSTARSFRPPLRPPRAPPTDAACAGRPGGEATSWPARRGA